MSLNKNDLKDAIKSAFIAADGKLRAVWTLSAALIFWHAVVIIGALGTSSILSALFESWGVTSASVAASSASSPGEMVSRSQPARARISPVLRKLAPIICTG